jgi:hypothetical protein
MIAPVGGMTMTRPAALPTISFNFRLFGIIRTLR